VSVHVVLTPAQLALERAADALLRAAPPDPEYPAFTDRQLGRHGRIVLSTAALAEMPVAPTQSIRDELRFLASVSGLDPDARRILGFWADGWAQTEISAACGVCQQRVSQVLRAALESCYDAVPLSFRAFSRHSIYRAPRRRREPCRMSICARCGEEYAIVAGAGRYCSTLCGEMAARSE